MAGEELTAKLGLIEQLTTKGDIAGLTERLLSEGTKAARLAAAAGLAVIGSAPALAPLGEILRSPLDPLAVEVIDILSQATGDEALLALAQGLAIHDVFLRSRVIKAIAGRQEPSALTFLVRASRDHTEEVARIGRRLLAARVRQAPADLEALRPEAVSGVMDVLAFEDVRAFLSAQTAPKVREAAIARLGNCEELEAIAFLVSACLSGDEAIAEAAMSAIEQNRHVPVEELACLLEQGPPKLYPRAFACFAERCSLTGVAALSNALRAQTPEVRRNAVGGLFRLLGPRALPMVTEVLGDEDESVCLKVVGCLEASPAAAAEKALVLAAIMGKPETQRRALAAIAAKDIFAPKLVDAHVAFLTEALKAARPEGQALDQICDTIKVLRHSKPEAAVDLLVKAALTASPRLRRTAMETLGTYPRHQRLLAYLGLVEASDIAVLMIVGLELAEGGSPHAIVPLIRAQASGSGGDVDRARAYLAKVPEMSDVQELLRLLRSPHVAVKRFVAKRLGDLGRPPTAEDEAGTPKEGAAAEGSASPDGQKKSELTANTGDAAASAEIFKLVGMLQSKDANVKRMAVQKLSQMRDRRALDALLQAVEDEDVEVQLAVVEALGSFVDQEDVAQRLIKFIDYGDVAVRTIAIEKLGEGKVLAAVDRLIGALSSVFLRHPAEDALRRIGDRRGYLAVVRRKKREALFPKKAKMERAKLEKLRGRHGKH